MFHVLQQLQLQVWLAAQVLTQPSCVRLQSSPFLPFLLQTVLFMLVVPPQVSLPQLPALCARVLPIRLPLDGHAPYGLLLPRVPARLLLWPRFRPADPLAPAAHVLLFQLLSALLPWHLVLLPTMRARYLPKLAHLPAPLPLGHLHTGQLLNSPTTLTGCRLTAIHVGALATQSHRP